MLMAMVSLVLMVMMMMLVVGGDGVLPGSSLTHLYLFVLFAAAGPGTALWLHFVLCLLKLHRHLPTLPSLFAIDDFTYDEPFNLKFLYEMWRLFHINFV